MQILWSFDPPPHSSNHVAASFPHISIWTIDHQIENLKTLQQSRKKMWKHHIPPKGFATQETTNLESNSNTNKWDETHRDAADTNNPSRNANNLAWTVESTDTSLLNCKITLPSEFLNTPPIPHLPELPKKKSSFTLIKPISGGFHTQLPLNFLGFPDTSMLPRLRIKSATVEICSPHFAFTHQAQSN